MGRIAMAGVALLGFLPVWSAGYEAQPHERAMAVIMFRMQVTVGLGGAPAPSDLEALYQFWRIPYARPDLGMPPAPAAQPKP